MLSSEQSQKKQTGSDVHHRNDTPVFNNGEQNKGLCSSGLYGLLSKTLQNFCHKVKRRLQKEALESELTWAGFVVKNERGELIVFFTDGLPLVIV